MTKEIEKAIATVVGAIKAGGSADDALKFSQAAVNLANAIEKLAYAAVTKT